MMDMDKLMARLTNKEGDRQFAYDDATGETLVPGMTIKGNISIGRGRNLGAKGLSVDERVMLEKNDINDAMALSERQEWWPIVCGDDVRSRAMIEIVFNIGIGKLNGFHNALACIMKKDFDGAATAFHDSAWDREIPERAKELEFMLRTGEDWSA